MAVLNYPGYKLSRSICLTVNCMLSRLNTCPDIQCGTLAGRCKGGEGEGGGRLIVGWWNLYTLFWLIYQLSTYVFAGFFILTANPSIWDFVNTSFLKGLFSRLENKRFMLENMFFLMCDNSGRIQSTNIGCTERTVEKVQVFSPGN